MPKPVEDGRRHVVPGQQTCPVHGGAALDHATRPRELWTKSRDLYARIGMPHMVAKLRAWLDGKDEGGRMKDENGGLKDER